VAFPGKLQLTFCPQKLLSLHVLFYCFNAFVHQLPSQSAVQHKSVVETAAAAATRAAPSQNSSHKAVIRMWQLFLIASSTYQAKG